MPDGVSRAPTARNLPRARGLVGILLTLGLAACSTPTTSSPGAHPESTPEPSPGPAVVEVAYRVEVRVADDDGFAPFLAAVMSDERGWGRARFDVREDPDAAFLVVLAEGDEVDALCLPYDTGGRFSCQNGPVVAINADRWREAVPHWPDDLESYRTMLLNHEMGHLLGQRHRDCPGPGELAPVMQQQSGSLRGCRANAWPLTTEIERAARHDLELAPAFGE